MALAISGSVNKNITSGSSTTITLSSSESNCLIVLFAVINDTTISSASSTNLTFTKRTSADGDGFCEEEWTAVAAGILTNEVITVNFAAATPYTTLDVFAISGANTSTKFDSHASLPATTVAADGRVTISTTSSDTMVIAGYRSASGDPAVGAGFTAISIGGNELVEYKIVSTPQTNLECGINGCVTNGGIGDAIVADIPVPGPALHVVRSGMRW